MDESGRNVLHTLADEYPKEQKRVREVLSIYESMRDSAQINVASVILMIKSVLEEAERAAVAGDAVRMVQSFYALRSIKA